MSSADKKASGSQTMRKIVQAIFFVLFVIACSLLAGYIIAVVFSITTVVAMGWIAASIAFIYLLHSGLFMKAFHFWMGIAEQVANIIDLIQVEFENA